MVPHSARSVRHCAGASHEQGMGKWSEAAAFAHAILFDCATMCFGSLVTHEIVVLHP